MPARRPDALSPWPFVGLTVLISALFLYGWAIVIVPWYAWVPMLLAWLVMFALCFIWWTPHPRRLVGMGVFAIVLWFAVLLGGAAAFGWSG